MMHNRSSVLVLISTACVALACAEATKPPVEGADAERTPAVLATNAAPGQVQGPISATATVRFHPLSGEITSTSPISGMGNVHARFSSVDQACLDFVFAGDLLSPEDEMWITVDGSDAGGFFAPPGSQPQETRTLCWVQAYHPGDVAHFLDGKAKFVFSMQSGSVTLGSVVLRVSGMGK